MDVCNKYTYHTCNIVFPDEEKIPSGSLLSLTGDIFTVTRAIVVAIACFYSYFPDCLPKCCLEVDEIPCCNTRRVATALSPAMFSSNTRQEFPRPSEGRRESGSTRAPDFKGAVSAAATFDALRPLHPAALAHFLSSTRPPLGIFELGPSLSPPRPKVYQLHLQS